MKTKAHNMRLHHLDNCFLPLIGCLQMYLTYDSRQVAFLPSGLSRLSQQNWLGIQQGAKYIYYPAIGKGCLLWLLWS